MVRIKRITMKISNTLVYEKYKVYFPHADMTICQRLTFENKLFS